MKPFFQTFTTFHALQNAWRVVRAKNSAGGIDGFSVAAFEKNLADNLHLLRHELLTEQWNPEPYLKVEIEKAGKAEKRKLGLLCIKDKIVQQAIKTAVEPQMDKMFLNISYGYRPERGAERAIRRVLHDLRHLKGGYVAKLDIDDFFDAVNHERLFVRLGNWLQDDKTLKLIRLCVQMGNVTAGFKWNDATKGIPQGAVLSPLLANFYLHPFDQFVSSRLPVYVRYADDFVIAAPTVSEVEDYIASIKENLNENFFLQLNAPIIKNICEGVEFLGVIVSDKGVFITEKKKKDLAERIQSITFTNTFLSAHSIETLRGIKNYYARLLSEDILKDLDCVLIERLNALIKRFHKNISSTKELSESLQALDFFSKNCQEKKKQLIQQLCSTYIVYSDRKKVLTALHAEPDSSKLIKQKKREYQKLENAGAELVVSTPGCSIGATYKGVVVRKQGKIVNKASAALKHITVVGKGVSVSSNALMYCMQHKIPIDFFNNRGVQYASVLSPQFIDDALWRKQAQLPLERKVRLASAIIVGKMKNQLNLVKYYHKYHKDVRDELLGQKYIEAVLTIEKNLEKAKACALDNVQYAKELMSLEAQAALAYWGYIRILLVDDGIEFVRREHQGATDLLNSLLNYGYAILYSRVWKNILAAKLNPSVGILHAHQNGKPTLVFDVVEIFRPQMVDRVVISLIQKGIPLKMHDGLLNEATKRTLIRHILERLNRYEKFRKEEKTLSEIILKQSQEIADFIAGTSNNFKPYVAKW